MKKVIQATGRVVSISHFAIVALFADVLYDVLLIYGLQRITLLVDTLSCTLVVVVVGNASVVLLMGSCDYKGSIIDLTFHTFSEQLFVFM